MFRISVHFFCVTQLILMQILSFIYIKCALGILDQLPQALYSTIFMFINNINVLRFGIMTIIGIYVGVCTRWRSEHL